MWSQGAAGDDRHAAGLNVGGFTARPAYNISSVYSVYTVHVYVHTAVSYSAAAAALLNINDAS